jgi:beta-lactamase regulating signal transducer with metallopeptidase domain
MRIILALAMAALAAAPATLSVMWLSRRARPNDARLWHSVWTALALASLVAPIAALLPPLWQVAVLVGPANPAAPTGGVSLSRLASAGTAATVIIIIGTVIALARLAAALYVTRRLAREAAPLDARDAGRVERIAPGFAGLCRTHRRLRVPVAIGWPRASIVLPESFGQWPDDRAIAILTHERAHIARRDFVWNAVASLHVALYWWNPLAWLVARRIRLTAELASDRDAAGADTTAYARHLIATAEEVLTEAACPPGILAPGAGTNLTARVDALLAELDAGPVTGRARRWAIALSAAVTVISPLVVQARLTTHQTPMDHTEKHAERHQALHQH